MPDSAGMNGSSASHKGWRGPVCLFSLAVGIIGLGTLARPGLFIGDTVTSRMATVYALVHDHTWRIDRPIDQPPNPFEPQTVDKVMSNGRLVSSKPPLIPLLMTALYLPMHAAGYTLDNPAHLKLLLWVMVFLLCQCSFALGIVFFAKTLLLFTDNHWRVVVPVLLLAFMSPLFGYAQQLNNHTPAAAALMAACYFGLGMYTRRLAFGPWRMAAFGLAAGLVCAMDLPVTIYPALLGLLLVCRFGFPALVWGGVGAFLPILIQVGATWLATGSLLPVQMREQTYVYEASYWRHPLGIDALNEPRGVYLFHMTLGRFGLFSLFPILLLGVLGGVLGLAGVGDKGRECRLFAGVGLGAFILLSAYYLKSTNNYGGASYGFRWYLGSVPVLMLMAAPLLARLRSRWAWGIVLLLAAVSLYSSWECLQAPWGNSHEWTCRLLFGPAV